MQRANHARGLRFLPKLAVITTVGLISAAIAYQASAQVNVYTSPVGFITWGIQGTTGSPVSPAATFLGLGMTQIPIQSGLVGTITSGGTFSTITDASGNWTNGQFNVAGTPCEVEFLSPSGSPTNWLYSGLIDEVASSTGPGSFTTANDDSALIAAGYRYQIRPSWTLNLLFGTTDQAGLQTGSTSGTADNINVWNPNTQGYTTYYYRTGNGWRSTASLTVNTGTNVLYLDEGILLARRGSTNVSVQLVGAVKDTDSTVANVGQTIIPIKGAATTIPGNVYAAAITLGNSGLYTTNSATGVQSGSTSGTADNINVFNPATQGFTTYYYRTGNGWRSTASLTIDASTNTIPLGASIVILRRNASSFNWYMPQPY